MASDLISRDEAIAAVDSLVPMGQDGLLMKAMVFAALKSTVPAVDAAPVVHGHWINHFDDLFQEDSTIECSECHEHTHYMPDDNYCPNCGARMDGGKA